MAQFSDQEKDTIRGGVLGALGLVSRADPGFFATFKESAAASRALSSAPREFAQLMSGGLVMPPRASSAADLEQKVLDQLDDAVQIAAKDPNTEQALRQFVLAGCQEVAQASKGVSSEEQAAIGRIQQVLDRAKGAPEDPGPDPIP